MLSHDSIEDHGNAHSYIGELFLLMQEEGQNIPRHCEKIGPPGGVDMVDTWPP